MYSYKKAHISTAQSLRKRMTPEEMHLWLDFLKKLPITVKRQACIEHYIVDFYIAKKKIAIEIDGLQHTLPENQEADRKRDEILKNLGITVLRYRNEDVNNHFVMVCENILEKLALK
jgi:very-short-patch-repair endonuclease